MESAEDAAPTESQPQVRKTRSGRVVRPPPAAKSPKSGGRKTKKKMVLMEVEVSDDDEANHENEPTSEGEDEPPSKKQKNGDSDTAKADIAEGNESDVDKAEEHTEEEKASGESKVSALEEVVQNNIDELHQKEENQTEQETAPKLMETSDIVEENLESSTKPEEETENTVSNPKEEIDDEAEKSAEVVCKKSPRKGPKSKQSPRKGKKADQEIEEDKADEVEESKPETSESDTVEEKHEDEVREDQERVEKKPESGIEEKEERSTERKKKKKSEEEKESTETEKEAKSSEKKETKKDQNGDPDAENISEDELPGVQVAKVPETEEVSDEELPGPKRAELPADTEVVSEDELPTVKKEGGAKRKLAEGDYDPGSPTSENDTPSKKPALESTIEKEKEEKPKPKKLPELDKYWKAVNDDPTDFTGWTYLLQYVDQENDMEAAREAYDAFLSHYPYCYGYWRKYADYEKRKGNKKKCEEVFERGFKAIPLSVDLWIHYMTYVKTARPDDEEYIRSQFERALAACGLEFRSDRLWDSFIKWESEAKRYQHVTAIYDRLLATPTQAYVSHFDAFQEHIMSNPPNKVVEVDEFLALRKEVRHTLKHDASTEAASDDADAPPGDEDPAKIISSDEETKAIRERIISIRRKIHKNTSAAVTARWIFEEGIKRPYFHVKPLERCQLKNWQDYLDYEIEHGERTRIVILFERCLIACALYEEFWLKFVHYLEGLKDPELQQKIRDVYERACTIHHLKKPNLHLRWAMFEESISNFNKAAEILVNLEKSVPNVLQVAYRRINLERRRCDYEKCTQLYEHYISNSKNKMIQSNVAIKYSRFCLKVLKSLDKAKEVLKTAIAKDPNNPRLYLQLIDLTIQGEEVCEKEVVGLVDSFLEKDNIDPDQKVLFAQRKLEFLEDFGSNIQCVQEAYDEYQKHVKQNKETMKKKEAKSEPPAPSKKDNKPTPPSSASNSYGNYGNYGNSSQGSGYQYSGSQGQYGYSQYGQGDQYQYQGWQYPQGNYGGYNQWGSYGGGYGY